MKIRGLQILLVWAGLLDISFAQVTLVKSLSQGNTFYYSNHYDAMGGSSGSSQTRVTVLTDTIINGKTYYRLSDNELEYADTSRLIEFELGSQAERLICDFSWSIGDTIQLGDTTYIVQDKGSANFFGQYLPYIQVYTSTPINIASNSRTIFKTFGIVTEYQNNFYVSTSEQLLAAELDGVVYGEIPTSVPSSNRADIAISVDVYPNPSSELFNIRLSLARSSNVSIEVFNLLGQPVSTVYQGQINRGQSILTWVPKSNQHIHLNSGFYFLRVRNGVQQFVRRIIIIR